MVLGVGIIGANPERGWSTISHVPAVQALDGLELRAVATSDQASAKAAEAAFKAKGYADAQALIADPAVDIVTVAVRVPAHRALVQAALDAGKAVYCEWPLGRDVADSQAIRDAATQAGVPVALGLQARFSPAVQRAAAMVADGAIGRVLSARLYSETVAFGAKTGAADAYLNDAANGATLLTIHGGHAMDAAIAILGPLADLRALLTTQHPQVPVEGGGDLRRTIADDMRVMATLGSGAALSLQVTGGRGPDSRFMFEIIGENGVLRLTGGAPRGFQSGVLTLALDGTDQALPDPAAPNLPDTAVNVAGVYAALRDDIERRTTRSPDFAHAVRLAQLCDDVIIASTSGDRQTENGWPQA